MMMAKSLKFSVGGSEKFFIKGNGRVGIGTSSPGAALEVSQEIPEDFKLRIELPIVVMQQQ